MPSSCLRRFLLVLALASIARSQTTYVVDAAGGPGAQFTDIFPAVLAAHDGDVILVRAGAYTGFQIVGKGISVLGEAGVRLTTPGTFRIDSIAAHQRVTVFGIETGQFNFAFFNTVQDCQGTVLLDHVTWVRDSGRFNVIGSDDVRLSGCSLFHPAQVLDSHLTASDTSFNQTVFATSPSYTLSVLNSEVVLSRCSVVGQSALLRAPSSAALFIDGTSNVTASDDGTHRITPGGGDLALRSAVYGSGTFVHDSRIQLLGQNGAPAVQGVTETTRALTSLSARGALVGSSVEVDLIGTPGEVFGLVLGEAGLRSEIPGIGGIGLGTVWIATAGVLNSASFHLSIPVAPGLPVGTTVCWQAIAGDGAGGFLLTNHATYVRSR